MLRGALGTLFATNATSQQKIFNEINDLRAAASAANPLIYKAFFFLLVSLWSKIVPTISLYHNTPLKRRGRTQKT